MKGLLKFVALMLAPSPWKPARPVVEALRERGLLAKETHGRTIRFSPPLVVTEAEVDWALERIAQVL